MPERAVILAAGVGARLKWLTSGSPKALMQVAGEAMIVHVIRHLAAQGIHDIAINVHHKAQKLVGALGDGGRFGVRLYFSHESKLLDSGGGVKQAMQLLPGDGPLLVHNTDVWADIDTFRLTGLLNPGCDAAIALVPNPSHHPRGDFGLDGGLVRPLQISCPTYTYAGVAIFKPFLFARYAEGEAFSLARLLSLLCRRERLRGFVHDGYWLDVGRPRDLWRAMRGVS